MSISQISPKPSPITAQGWPLVGHKTAQECPLPVTPHSHDSIFRSIQLSSFLASHLLNDVKPVLVNAGLVPSNTTLQDIVKAIPVTNLIPAENLSRLKNAVRTLTKYAALPNGRQRQIVFPGRDTWLFYLLARKSPKANVLYDPTISRLTANTTKAWQKWDKDAIIFDTGFSGSIASILISNSKKRFDSWMLSTEGGAGKFTLDIDTSYTPYGAATVKLPIHKQLYPNQKPARALALFVEYLPKYHKRGRTEMLYYQGPHPVCGGCYGCLAQRNPDGSFKPSGFLDTGYYGCAAWDKWHRNSVWKGVQTITQDLAPIKEYLKAVGVSIEVWTKRVPAYTKAKQVVGSHEMYKDD